MFRVRERQKERPQPMKYTHPSTAAVAHVTVTSDSHDSEFPGSPELGRLPPLHPGTRGFSSTIEYGGEGTPMRSSLRNSPVTSHSPDSTPRVTFQEDVAIGPSRESSLAPGYYDDYGRTSSFAQGTSGDYGQARPSSFAGGTSGDYGQGRPSSIASGQSADYGQARPSSFAQGSSMDRDRRGGLVRADLLLRISVRHPLPRTQTPPNRDSPPRVRVKSVREHPLSRGYRVPRRTRHGNHQRLTLDRLHRRWMPDGLQRRDLPHPRWTRHRSHLRPKRVRPHPW